MIEHAINIVFIKLSSVLKPHSPQKTVDTSEMLSLQKGEERRKKKQLAYKAAPIYVLAVPLKWQSGSVRWLLCREAHFKAGHFISDRQPQVEHEIKNKKEGERKRNQYSRPGFFLQALRCSLCWNIQVSTWTVPQLYLNLLQKKPENRLAFFFFFFKHIWSSALSNIVSKLLQPQYYSAVKS